MIRLLTIEWYKLRHYRPFWVLIIMYAALSTLVCSSGMFLMAYLKGEGADFRGFDPTMLPLYDFPDVWHNMTYIAARLKIILAFIIIMSIFNEINHRTLRQNIIDGLSKKEWLGSKVLLMGAISLGAGLLLFVNGLILGLIYSHPEAYQYIFQRLDFIVAYCLDVFTYLSFAMMLALIFRKGGLVIVGLLMYSAMFEPFLAAFLYNFPPLPEYARAIPDFLPVQSLRNLIQVPFRRFLLMEIQEFIPLKTLLIALTWLTVYLRVSFWLLSKRDI
ncbi:MAG: ABC transporter permease subunit [Bacteroidota bacterium]